MSIIEIKKWAIPYEYDYLLNKIFSIDNIADNLIYLNLQLEPPYLMAYQFKNINNFKSLKQLFLDGIKFLHPHFKFDLPNLIELKLNNCELIYFSKISCLNLKKKRLLILILNIYYLIMNFCII